MRKTDFLVREYYSLIDCLPRLSQEEIVALYESENIPYTDLDLEIQELENKKAIEIDNEKLDQRLKELKKKRESSVAYRYFLTILGRKHNIRRYPSRELRNKIVEGTMYLVIINAGVIYKLENNKLSFDDLVQYGMEALISAVHYYVPGGEAKFHTYACKCIRNKMFKMMSDSHKMKKRSEKVEDFFEKEKFRIRELELLLETEEIKLEYGGGYQNNTEEHLIIYRLNKKIANYNQWRDKRGEHNLKIKKVYGKTIDEIIERYNKLFKDRKLNLMVTDQERQDVEAYLAYKRASGAEGYYLRSKCYLEIYKSKLDFIEKYINAENRLLKSGKDPSLENILKELNGNISAVNKQISSLRKSGFYEECLKSHMNLDGFQYKSLFSYYEEYLERYGIDILIEEDYCDRLCRATEIEEIKKEYRESHWIYTNIVTNIIPKLKSGSSKEVYVYLNNDDKVIDTVPYVPYDQLSAEDMEYYDEEEYYCYQSDEDFGAFERVDRRELLKRLNQELVDIEDEDTYVKKVLRERSTKVNESLKIKNAPIIEENLKIKEIEDLYNLGKKYHKYLKERDFTQLCESINLLYEDDPELIDLLLENDKSKSRRLTVEEEALDNLFLEDYYAALEELDDLQKEIMQLYYDENGCSPLTLQQVADALGISLSKVKREKAKALKKLRNNEILLSYYNEN